MLRIYRTVIAPELTPIEDSINYCREKRNKGCGIYIPQEILDCLGLETGDCLEVYVPKYGRKCIILVPENATRKPRLDVFKKWPNPYQHAHPCPKDTYKIRKLDNNAREMWLLEKGGVVRFPEEIAKYFGFTVNDCECKYILAELYVVKDKRWIVVENFKFL